MTVDEVLKFTDSEYPRVIIRNTKYIVAPDGRVLVFNRVGNGDRWATNGTTVRLDAPRPLWMLDDDWQQLLAARPTTTH